MPEFQDVAPGVVAVAHDFVEGNNAIIFGDDGALAIDGGNYVEDGEAMAAYMRERGSPASRLALTHGHGDHVLGAAPLAAGEVFAHDKTPGVMERQVSGWARQSGVSEAEFRARLPWPTATFSDELCIHLGGGRTVRLLPTPGHSEDGVSALVQDAGVLIGGDAVVTGIVPAIGDGDSGQLERSLRVLLEIDIRVLVPGHGAVVHGREMVRDWLTWEAEYLASVRARVLEIVEAADGAIAVEAVAEAITYGDFVGDRLSPERHNMPKRHRNTVLKIIDEVVSARRVV